jgi:hypothetical protein
MSKKKKQRIPTPDELFIWELMKAARRAEKRAISNEKKKTQKE